MLRDYQWPHNVALLEAARADGCLTALATMSHREQVRYVLDALNLTDAFDFVATRDDVEQGKPHPEIYQLVMAQLDVSPEDTLIIEDSVNGVKAALAAGTHVIAVATDFTRGSLHAADGLDGAIIVYDPSTLLSEVQQFVALQAVD
jgi:beta-phosphoglucomutase